MLHESLVSISSNLQRGALKPSRAALKQLLEDKKTLQEFSSLDWTECASLLRRVDLSERGFRILAPRVRGTPRRPAKPSSEMKVEFAAILLNLQLVQEARGILRAADLAQNVRARIQLAYSYLHTYEFNEAIVLLESVLRKPNALTVYERCLVEVNLLLARAQCIPPGKRATELLMRISMHAQRCEEAGYELLRQALLAIGARVAFLSGEQMQHWLAQLRTVPAQSFPGLMGQLFEAFLLYRVGEISSSVLRLRLNRIEQKARERREFEIVRELDFQRARLTESPAQLGNRLLSSGLRSFRRHMAGLYSLHVHPVATGVRVLRDRVRQTSVHEIEVKGSPRLMQLLQLLVEEQHAPISIGRIWDQLMSPALYLEGSSRDAVHQWVMRLKEGLARMRAPVRLVWQKRGYQLLPETNQEIRFRFPLNYGEEVASITGPIRLSTLLQWFPRIPRRTHQLYLQRAVEQGRLLRKGKGRATYYVPAPKPNRPTGA